MFPIQSCIASPDEVTIELINGLTYAVTESHYTALIQQKEIHSIELLDSDSSDDYAEVKHIITAEVIETYHGDVKEVISYSMVMEKGEDVIIENNPIIITLCNNDKEMVWPGVGTHFKASQVLIGKAKELGTSIDQNKTDFELCE